MDQIKWLWKMNCMYSKSNVQQTQSTIKHFNKGDWIKADVLSADYEMQHSSIGEHYYRSILQS